MKQLPSEIFFLRPAPFGGLVCAGAVVLFSSNASAQNLFEADDHTGNIYEFTPGGTQSTFASGLSLGDVSGPSGLAFNSADDLFVATP
jgi:hypothetical protein